MRIRIDCTVKSGHWTARGLFTATSTAGYQDHGYLAALDVDPTYRIITIAREDYDDILARGTKISSSKQKPSVTGDGGTTVQEQEKTMPTFETIEKDWKAARFAKETDKATKLGTLRSDCLKLAKDAKPPRDTPTEGEVQKAIKALLSGLQTTREALVKSGGEGEPRIADVDAEVTLIKSYQKEQLDEAAMRAAVDTYVAENPYGEDTPASSMKSMGPLKRFFEDRYAGQYDGSLIQKILKERIG